MADTDLGFIGLGFVFDLVDDDSFLLIRFLMTACGLFAFAFEYAELICFALVTIYFASPFHVFTQF